MSDFNNCDWVKTGVGAFKKQLLRWELNPSYLPYLSDTLTTELLGASWGDRSY